MSSVKTEGLEDYNPFSASDKFRQNEPAIVSTGDIDIATEYKTNEATSLISTGKSIPNYRQERKRKTSEIIKSQENNWPPIPGFCPCQPCFYHNITGDIPQAMQSLLEGAYYLWIGYSITMIFNVFGALAYFLSTGSMEAGSTFGMSAVLVALLPGLMFLGWYRPLYKAAKFDSSVSYFIYFLTAFGQVIVTSIQCIGINWLGACGWLNGSIVLIRYKTAGCIMLLIATLFTILLAGQIVLLIQVHRKYRNIEPPSESDFKDEVKRSESIREIATASMRNGSNYVLEDIRDNK